MGESGIGDLGSCDAKTGETSQTAHMLNGFVGDLSVLQAELLQLGQFLQMGQTFVGQWRAGRPAGAEVQIFERL